jgi:hypothetical protein
MLEIYRVSLTNVIFLLAFEIQKYFYRGFAFVEIINYTS